MRMKAPEPQHAYRVDVTVVTPSCPLSGLLTPVFGYGRTIQEAAAHAAARMPNEIARELAVYGFAMDGVKVSPVLHLRWHGVDLYTAPDDPRIQHQHYHTTDTNKDVAAGLRADPRVQRYAPLKARYARARNSANKRAEAEERRRRSTTYAQKALAWLRKLVRR